MQKGRRLDFGKMGKHSIILTLFLLLITIGMAYSEKKVTKLRFFVQDRNTGNQTVYKVAESSITSTSRTLFGQLNVVDDPFTIEPEPESKTLGRAQGVIAFADLNEIGLHMSITFVFTSGKYKGSTLSMLGRNNLFQKYRIMPIVGGTGAFDLVRGTVNTSTYSFDVATRNAILEYNIYLTH